MRDDERTGPPPKPKDKVEVVVQTVLRPLPTAHFVFSETEFARVNIDFHIEFESHYYSVLDALGSGRFALSRPAIHPPAYTRAFQCTLERLDELDPEAIDDPPDPRLLRIWRLPDRAALSYDAKAGFGITIRPGSRSVVEHQAIS